MEHQTIDVEAGRRAVRHAMRQLAARNRRTYSLNVVDAAIRAFEAETPGRANILRAAEAVKAAILEMDEAGELECHVEPRRDWRLLG